MRAGAADGGSARRFGFVPETRFGRWFLDTQTWSDRVLKVAIDDLRRLMPDPAAAFPVVLDVGCGHGRSLSLLMAAFRPGRLIGLRSSRRSWRMRCRAPPGWAGR